MEEHTYPKNRTDLILLETITKDIKTLIEIQDKYRGLEKSEEFKKNTLDLIRLLREIVD